MGCTIEGVFKSRDSLAQGGAVLSDRTALWLSSGVRSAHSATRTSSQRRDGGRELSYSSEEVNGNPRDIKIQVSK